MTGETAAASAHDGARAARSIVVGGFGALFFHLSDFTWKRTYWLGVPVWKYPFDLWMYQEIVWKIRPDVIIETGTLFGGSALYLASLCDMIGSGRVVTVDIERREGLPVHDRIAYINGSSTDPEIVCTVAQQCSGTVMAIFDSDHSFEHVAAELDAYSPIVSAGSYIIVEDTNISHLVGMSDPRYRGPAEAVDEFLAVHPEFTVDRACERFGLTLLPGGYLRRR